MKIVDTFTQGDFDALVAAGMNYMNTPLQQEEIKFIRSVRFEITDEVYANLDLDNRHDVTIQTVQSLRFEHCSDCEGRGHDLNLSTCFTCSGSGIN